MMIQYIIGEMDKLSIILILVILFVFGLIMYKNKPVPDVEQLIVMEDIPNIKPTPIPRQRINPNFIEAKFHADFMDVASAFNDLAPTQRQIFNINNVPCKISQNVDSKLIGEILEEFIEEVNDDIKTNVPLIHTVNSGWDEVVPEHTVESGWEKVQKQLGLPTSLYTKPKMNTHVSLVNFSDITKYEIEKEIKYTCQLVLQKDKVKDKLVVQLSFVLPKDLDGRKIIIETIDILGYLTEQGLGVDRQETDDFYYFDSLNRSNHNMLSGDIILTEMMKKYNMRQKVMQERIDGSDDFVKQKYREIPSPAQYDSYQLTQTVISDMTNEKKFM
jgi:hypothetical protein